MWNRFQNSNSSFWSNGSLFDDNVDILDVVSMVAVVLGNSEPIECADYNDDGSIDVLDIVNVVSLILGS